MNKSNLPIGNNIRKWRTLKGIKQKDFAKQVGICKSTLSKIENDSQEIKIPLLQKIAACLKVKIIYLFVDPYDLLPPSTDKP